MSRVRALAQALAVLAVASGCGAQRTVAHRGIAAAQVEFAGIRERAEVLLPDESRSIADGIDQARDDAERGNYRGAILATHALRTRVKELGERLPARQAELESAWTKLEGSIPNTLAALESRVRATRRPAQGPRRITFDAYQRELGSIDDLWDEARDARRAGRLAEAVSKAGDVRYRALKLLDAAPTGS